MNEFIPRISVILTAYNSESFLKDALESVFRQTLQPTQIVLVDDGSTDGTKDIAQSFDRKVLKYIWQPNQGEGAARNRGIRDASGEWIAFLDADDIWLDDKLQRQIEFVRSHPEVGLVSGNKIWWDVEKDSRHLVKYGQVPIQKLNKELIVSNAVGDPSLVLVKRDLFEKVGLFRTDLHIGVDWEMWLRIARVTSVGFIDAPLAIYRWHPKNVSHRYFTQRVESEENISLGALQQYPHPFERVELFLRVRSQTRLKLTYDVIESGDSRLKQFGYALAALLLFPFEDSGKKIRLLLRSIVGGRIYLALKSKFQFLDG